MSITWLIVFVFIQRFEVVLRWNDFFSSSFWQLQKFLDNEILLPVKISIKIEPDSGRALIKCHFDFCSKTLQTQTKELDCVCVKLYQSEWNASSSIFNDKNQLNVACERSKQEKVKMIHSISTFNRGSVYARLTRIINENLHFYTRNLLTHLPCHFYSKNRNVAPWNFRFVFFFKELGFIELWRNFEFKDINKKRQLVAKGWTSNHNIVNNWQINWKILKIRILVRESCRFDKSWFVIYFFKHNSLLLISPLANHKFVAKSEGNALKILKFKKRSAARLWSPVSCLDHHNFLIMRTWSLFISKKQNVLQAFRVSVPLNSYLLNLCIRNKIGIMHVDKVLRNNKSIKFFFLL